jgi:transposase
VSSATTRKRTPQWARYKEEILRLEAEQPDLTLPELQAALGTTLCTATLSNALRALKLTFKKVIHAAEQDRPDVAERRLSW